MLHDKWLTDWADRLRRARTPAEAEAKLDGGEHHCYAFAGPGRKRVEQFMALARQRQREVCRAHQDGFPVY